MGLKVVLEDFVSVPQHPLDPLADRPGAGSSRAERQGVLDTISKPAGVRPLRLEAVQMAPVGERTFHLLIRELALGNVVPVAG